ncbi:hypothetical protein DBR32_09965 [Taibaiella sp. KBW10]|uniref:M14 family zinc carboxypeptidase n=1 Tax=Taibaiella sp. KBW10 TaxID=2153357 RepID=UPI000F59B56C|nr:M14 family zinc carboxypeptidase [Taibaiella sp. KBW10]RQO31023.1 hypothetical protein DBR32_09965 [Taibaiella sp. KBW10]
MTKFFYAFFLLLISSSMYAQTPEIYSRVKITTGTDGLKQLAEAGIAVDHGTFKKDQYFISDFSPWELTKIKASGLPYEIQIEDVSTYYANRNKEQTTQKAFGGEGCDACEVYATPVNFQLGTMGGFYKYQELLRALDSMRSKYPTLITVKQPISTTLTTIEGRPIYYVKISQNADVASTRPQVMYSALHHAREAESLSQLIFYMWYLLENYATDDYVKYLVDHTEMYFVPCLNPDGYIYNETTNPNGGGMWRKNRRNNGDGSFGVDINRNYGQFWGYDNLGSSNDSQDESYKGTAGFSEPETQIMRAFCNSHSFKMALNAHTFSNLLIYPWGHIPSAETPDSLAFRHFGKDLTSCSGFVAGTGNETVGYVVNGDSDDWMYGEQTSKPKIFSMTPEAGNESDGFWPMSNRIIPIAKQTMDQNLDLAKFATPFAELFSTDAPFMKVGTGRVHLNLKRVGLGTSNFTVSLIPVTSNISFVAPVTFNNPDHLINYADSIGYNIISSAAPGSTVRFALKWENADGFSHSDTVTRYIGTGDTAFHNNGSSMAGLQSSDGWGVSTTQFQTPGGSITESPNGDYTASSTSNVTTSTAIDLTGASAAYLSFYAKWDIEKSYDDVTVSAAQENGSYNILCGRFSHLGSERQNNRKAIYDGSQSEWVKEYIDLKDYLGKKINIRFTLKSDPGGEKDGFYFDEMAVVKIGGNVGIKERQLSGITLQNVPNPCTTNTRIVYKLPQKKHQYYLNITDATGRIIVQERLNPGTESFDLDLRPYSSGVYFYHIVSDQGLRSEVKKMIVLP